jgi:hypothetical protein
MCTFRIVDGSALLRMGHAQIQTTIHTRTSEMHADLLVNICFHQIQRIHMTDIRIRFTANRQIRRVLQNRL